MNEQELAQALFDVVKRLRAQGLGAEAIRALISVPELFAALDLPVPGTRPVDRSPGGLPPQPASGAASASAPAGLRAARQRPPHRPAVRPALGVTPAWSEAPRAAAGQAWPQTMVEGREATDDDSGGARSWPSETVHEVTGRSRASTRALAASQAPTAPSEADARSVIDSLASARPPVERLELGAELGRGGMGRVVEAFDPTLQRKVAVKLLLDPSQVSARQLARFVAEAQITAQLDHPGVVPVHDLGVSSTGELYFVMKRVRGRSLRDLLLGLAGGDGALRAAWTRRRLLHAFVQVCNAVAYAHEQGVIHRDLKPDNIMLGSFGEVLVMDWGVARAPQSVALERGRAPSGAVRRLEMVATRDGATIGTPGYMSPEQACGDHEAMDARSDVWSLGAILYEVLTWRRAFEASNAVSLMVEGARLPMDPRERAPERKIPAEIARVCLQALSPVAEARYESAKALGEAVEAFLEGAARKRAAARHLEAAARHWERYEAGCRERAELAAWEEALVSFYEPHTPLEERGELLSVRVKRDEAARALTRTFEQVITSCEAALSHDPEHAPARALLAEVYWTRLLEAEARGDGADAAVQAGRVRAYGGARHRVLLRGEGSVSLETSPSGAQVRCQRVVQKGLLWTLEPARSLGATPIDERPLAMGSYLLTIERPDGGGAVCYPVSIRRGQRWRAARPLRLYGAQEVGAGFVRVAEGPFWCGDDSDALEALAGAWCEVGDVFMARYPVTMGEYCEFLNAVLARDPDEAWARAPRRDSGLKAATEGQYWERPGAGEVYVVPPVDGDGDRWDPRWPASGISWHDARAYVTWRSARDGRAYELPTELEWEKAARGVDARPYPWGERFDATLCKMRDSRSGRPRPEGVGAFARDCSIYGVRDVAGSMREWCADLAFNGDPDRRVARGGAWQDEARACRLASRWGLAPWHAASFTGLRLAWHPRDDPRA